MHKFKPLHGDNEVIFLEDTKCSIYEITNIFLKDFEPRGNNLNLECKNSFIKQYFKQISVRGIFNQVEWKFLLKKGIKGEILTPANNSRQQGRLLLRVILEFSRNQVKVSVSFCPDEPQFKETLIRTQPELSLNRIHAQTPSYSHSARTIALA